MIVLNNDQQDELIESFVELQVDNLDTKTMVAWITDMLTDDYRKLTKEELKERIDCYQDDLFDELVDNVTNEIAQPKVTVTPSKVIITDDDYADKVDTLVGNMVASDDNVYTHDSEGC